jgi:hypothetical protein
VAHRQDFSIMDFKEYRLTIAPKSDTIQNTKDLYDAPTDSYDELGIVEYYFSAPNNLPAYFLLKVAKGILFENGWCITDTVYQVRRRQSHKV